MKKLKVFEREEYKRRDGNPLSEADTKLIREICNVDDAEIIGAIQNSRSLEDFMKGFLKNHAEILVGDFISYYLCVTELIEFMQSFLPRELMKLFEIVKIDDQPSDWRVDIYLDERKVVPNHLHDAPVIAYGFVEAITIQDFPLRGKAVFLHIRRRKWLNKSDNTIHTTHFDITYPDTQLTEEWVAFLKATRQQELPLDPP